MKIHNGKATYTGREQIERVLKHKDEEIQRLRSQLGTVGHWADAMRDKHKPYISGKMDVSIAETEKKADALCAQIRRNLFCAECSTTWPCKYIEDLGELRYFVLDRMDESDEDDFKKKIREMEPKDKRGIIDTHI